MVVQARPTHGTCARPRRLATPAGCGHIATPSHGECRLRWPLRQPFVQRKEAGARGRAHRARAGAADKWTACQCCTEREGGRGPARAPPLLTVFFLLPSPRRRHAHAHNPLRHARSATPGPRELAPSAPLTLERDPVWDRAAPSATRQKNSNRQCLCVFFCFCFRVGGVTKAARGLPGNAHTHVCRRHMFS